uniref:Cysteine and histidine-rich domain-containing protein 1 n=1 Tax=Lepeophtheirus salmonis TaxID=72036 RepID=D3PH74_LEPSM|nr:Cysteine and histidine-rich domain-containing protein 1 [Lepeophtheirus salmonis]
MSELLCYNPGCGNKFNPTKNGEDACKFHSGTPVFHDAYKFWSCCGKKTTDFSTFLSTPPCTSGPHTNIPPKESLDVKRSSSEEKTILNERPKEWNPPQPALSSLKRPPLDTKCFRPKPKIASSIQGLSFEKSVKEVSEGGAMNPEEPCKNGGCKITYGEAIEETQCVYHNGVPIFHEGMKFWSCCQKKTSDFQSFLNQEGCQRGDHKWIKDNEGNEKIECRYDWHQTSNTVSLAIYAKKYDPNLSYVEFNPIRLVAHIFFPEQGGAFDMDIELNGVIDTEKTQVSMNGSKVEICMKKAELFTWSKLSVPKTKTTKMSEILSPKNETEYTVDSLDLDDLDLTVSKPVLSFEASGGKSGAKIL